jgi:hypothetical protein
MENWRNDTDRGKPEGPREKSVPAPISPPNILNKLACHWTRTYKQESAPWRYSVQNVIILYFVFGGSFKEAGIFWRLPNEVRAKNVHKSVKIAGNVIEIRTRYLCSLEHYHRANLLIGIVILMKWFTSGIWNCNGADWCYEGTGTMIPAQVFKKALLRVRRYSSHRNADTLRFHQSSTNAGTH